MSIDNDAELKKLVFRSGHRGCKETDLILGRFATTQLSGLNMADRAVYARLLDENDADIWDWITGKTLTPDPAYVPLIEAFKAYVPEL